MSKHSEDRRTAAAAVWKVPACFMSFLFGGPPPVSRTQQKARRLTLPNGCALQDKDTGRKYDNTYFHISRGRWSEDTGAAESRQRTEGWPTSALNEEVGLTWEKALSLEYYLNKSHGDEKCAENEMVLQIRIRMLYSPPNYSLLQLQLNVYK